LVLLLLAVAGYFSWQQVSSLRTLAHIDGLAPEDRHYIRNMAVRRLVGCTMLTGIAVLIAVAFMSGLEDRVQKLADLRQSMPEGPKPELDDEQRVLVKIYLGYAVTLLLLLFGVVSLAAIDVWAIRRYGRRHYQRIKGDRREMLEQQLRILRSERGPRPEDN
jgi:hypothetical protein